METLLKRAKEVEIQKNKIVAGEEMLELAIAWFNGEVTTVQATIAIYGNEGKKNSGIFVYRAATSLRTAIKLNRIKIEKDPYNG